MPDGTQTHATENPSSTKTASLSAQAPESALGNLVELRTEMVRLEHERSEEVERAIALYKDRIRQLEADRWRLGERIDDLEGQNADLQATAQAQTSALQAELAAARAELYPVQDRRHDDYQQAHQHETQRLHSVRAPAEAELRAARQQRDNLINALTVAKDQVLAASRSHTEELRQVLQAHDVRIGEVRGESADALSKALERSEKLQNALEGAREALHELRLTHAHAQLEQVRSTAELEKRAAVELALARSEKQRLASALTELSVKLEHAEERSRARIEAARAEAQKLSEELARSTEQLTTLERRSAEQQAQYGKLEQTHRVLLTQHETAQRTNEEHRKAREALQTEYVEQRKRAGDLEAQLDRTSQQLQAAEQLSAEQQDARAKLEQGQSTLQKDYAQARQALEEQVSARQALQAQHLAQVQLTQVLEVEFDRLSQQLKAAEERSAEQQATGEELDQKHAALRAEYARLQLSLEEEVRASRALQADYQTQREVEATRRQEQDALQQRILELEAGLAEHEVRTSRLNMELNEARQNAQVARQEAENLRSALLQRQQGLRERELTETGKVQQLERERAALTQELQRYQQHVVSLEEKVDHTKNTLSFRLGHLLIHAPKSLNGLSRLPRELVELGTEARRRKHARRYDPSARAHGTQALTEQTLQSYFAGGIQAAIVVAEKASADAKDKAAALTHLAKAVKTSNPSAACNIARKAHEVDPQPFRAKWLAFLQYECGQIRDPAALLQALPVGTPLRSSEQARLKQIAGLRRLLTQLPAIPAATKPRYAPRTRSALYVAANSLPFQITGYTIRTQELLKALHATEWQMSCALRPGYPADRGIELANASTSHEVDGVCYQHLAGPHRGRTPLDEYFQAATTALVELAQSLRPQLIHAASNHVNALPALLAARQLGVPFIYEIRGMWELTAASRYADWETSERYMLERQLETLVAREADQVITLTEGLREEFAERGIAKNRIHLVCNSVDTKVFTPRRKDPELSLRHGVNAAHLTIVYVGSVLPYEGLDDLVRALAQLANEQIEALLLIAGEGDAVEPLKQLATQLGVAHKLRFLGQISREDVPRLWSLADVAVFPRKPFRVCQLVAPIKPLEPMAMGVPVIVSDVSALREMLIAEQTGLIHRADDPRSLTEQLSRLARDPDLRQRLGTAGREWVVRERTWQRAAERVLDVYRFALQAETRAVSPSLEQQASSDVVPRPPSGERDCEPDSARGLDIVPVSSGGNAMTPEEKDLFDAQLCKAFAGGGSAAVRSFALRQAEGRSPRFLAFTLLKAATCCQRLGDVPASLQLARAARATDPAAGTLRGVVRTLYAGCDFQGAANTVGELELALGGLRDKDDELAREVRGRAQLIAEATLAQPAVLTPGALERSVYFLHFSLPYTSVGYATRSQGLVVGVQRARWDIRCYTRLGFPYDFKPELQGQILPDVDVVDGVEYRRLFAGGRRGTGESDYLLASADSYERVLRSERPAIVHAASSYVTALPALVAARRLGLPFVYEIRGFWEVTRSSRDNDFEGSARYGFMRYFEDLVAHEADLVLTLTSPMRDELARRGIAREKIALVHNGVDTERFQPLQRDDALADELGLPRGIPVIGYVGSFVDYEGLDDLVLAAAMLKRKNHDFRLLLVGDGAMMDTLQSLVQSEDLGDRVLLTGRVPHELVEAHYSLLDICPFPRKPWEVCEMVSPLKPFEAMAMEKAVVVSDTLALREIVHEGVNGTLFKKGDVSALAYALERLLVDEAFRVRLGLDARRWVCRERTWDRAGEVVVACYQQLLQCKHLPLRVAGAQPS